MQTTRMGAVLTSIRKETEHVLSIELRPTADDKLFPAFTAGAHIDCYLGNGIVRSYSLCNSPNEQHRYVIGVLKDRNSRGGSQWIHDQLQLGDAIQISAPRNNFNLVEAAPHTVLLAGGIGITPFLSMAQRLKKLGRKALLFYCVRGCHDLAFIQQLRDMTDSQFELRVHLDDEMGGPLDIERSLAGLGAEGHYYCCGPTGMLNAFASACDRLGYRHRHVERFHASLNMSSPTREFTVELARSGKAIQINEEESLLQGLLRHGVLMEYSCQEGMCGACEIPVLSGEIDHRDSILSEAERQAGQTIITCVSRGKSDILVLDL